MTKQYKNLLIGSALIIPFLALQGFRSDRDNPHQFRSSGNAVAGEDRTGSPLSSATCTFCHSSAGTFTDVASTISIKNSNNEEVTSYTPGESYTIELEISTNGSPAGYGGQLTILDKDDKMAGDLVSTSTSNTQISTIGSVEYLEHSGRNSAGKLTAKYTAPTQGTGNITIYAIGLAANGTGSSGDNVSPAITFQFTEEVSNDGDNNDGDNEPTRVNNIDFSNEITAYPNPSKGRYTINLGQELNEVTTKLQSASGNLIETKVLSSVKEFSFEISQPAGIYFLTIETESKSATIRLVKD